jgi:hypothetical protein
MVRWQEALYRTRPALRRLPCSPRVVDESQRFIGAYDTRKNAEAYPDHLRSLNECFYETAKALRKHGDTLDKAVAAMKGDLSLAAREDAHRGYLLALQRAVGPVAR